MREYPYGLSNMMNLSDATQKYETLRIEIEIQGCCKKVQQNKKYITKIKKSRLVVENMAKQEI